LFFLLQKLKDQEIKLFKKYNKIAVNTI